MNSKIIQLLLILLIAIVSIAMYSQGFDVAVEWAMAADVNSGFEAKIARPDEYTLYQNYPNPFNPSTYIMYQIMHASKIRLDVFNVQGRHICNLEATHKPAGFYSVEWDGRKENNQFVAPGIYFFVFDVQIKDKHLIESKKMVYLK